MTVVPTAESMKVTVDWGGCRGHDVCLTVCPEMFSLTDDGYAQVPSPDVPLEFEQGVAYAERASHEHAIDVH